jgi:non-ribosomal peptide synthetase component F
LLAHKSDEGMLQNLNRLCAKITKVQLPRYRNRPDLTDARFAVHPELGKRLYRTGDRGKMLPDGSVFLLGCMDREVKMRGYQLV